MRLDEVKNTISITVIFQLTLRVSQKTTPQITRIFTFDRLFSGSVRNFKRPPKNKFLKPSGAHSVHPKSFENFNSYHKYFGQFFDTDKYTSSMFTFQTVTHKTDDTHHPLLMLTNREGHRYFFGKVCEGAQRSLNENRIRLSRLKTIFLTGTLNSWSQIGGLPGLFLTISDSTKKDIEVYANCGSVLSYIVATWRYFVFRKGVELKVSEAEDGKLIADTNIMVKPIKIQSKAGPVQFSSETVTRRLRKLTLLMFPQDVAANDPNPNSYKSDPADLDIQTHVDFDFTPNGNHQDSLSYLVRFSPLRGKFDVNRAKELNIEPGVNFRSLTQGSPVANRDGVMIMPEQVIGDSKKFMKVLILDIPSADYLENTVKCDSWEETGDWGDEPIGLVYHLLGDEINFELQQYIDFIQRFHPDCQHIISHSKLAKNTIVFKTFASFLLKFRAIQPENFNLPHSEPYDDCCTSLSQNFKVKALHNLQKIDIESDGLSIDESAISTQNWDEMYEEHISPLGIKVEKSKTIDTTPLSLYETPFDSLKDNVQVTTLGTGSALPSLHRNVLSNLIRMPFRDSQGRITYKSVLLDGGENTLGSILRTFGHQEQYKTIFEELGLIYLSHLHADHHLGLISIINKWFQINKDNDKTLHLVIPWQYDHFLREWYKLEEHVCDLTRINYVSCEDFVKHRSPEYSRMSMDEFEENFDEGLVKFEIPRDKINPINKHGISKLYKDMNLNQIRACRAIHCYWAYSVALEFKLDDRETFTVSYSGDTRPNPKFVDIGYGSDLLIHESTLDNELIEEAISKKHTTMIEAVNSARYMDCDRLILTHFSTRYSKGVNFIDSNETFQRLSTELKDYLSTYNSHSIAQTNVFLLEETFKRPIKEFNNLEILFAFDTLIVQLGQIKNQKQHMEVLNEVLELVEEADTKEVEKARVKRESKRNKRLLTQKKRKTSSDEE